MDQICWEMVAWKSLNNPGKLGRTRQEGAGSPGGLREIVEKQFPDVAWFSWEYSRISVIPRPRALAGPSLGLSQSPRPALLLLSLCSPSISHSRLSLGEIQPCPAPSLLDLEVVFPSYQEDRTLLLDFLPLQARLSQAPGAAGGSIPLFPRSSIQRSSSSSAFPGLGRGLGCPSSSLGMLAPPGQARGQGTPGAGGLSTLSRKTGAGREPWDYFNLPCTEHSAAFLILLGARARGWDGVWDGFGMVSQGCPGSRSRVDPSGRLLLSLQSSAHTKERFQKELPAPRGCFPP